VLKNGYGSFAVGSVAIVESGVIKCIWELF